MKNVKNEIKVGDIFIIPLFLPCYQEWRTTEELIDYKKYQFCKNDLYAFGRLIDIDMGNCNLIEIFSYVGKIPESPKVILSSGRMFEPAYVVGVFSRSRWRFLFSDPHYDKWIDSDYKNISFMLHSELWKGGDKFHITQQQKSEFLQSGIPFMVIHGGPALERKIRLLLSEQGVELDYEQTVEKRKNDYPQPRDIDRKLKETIFPFRWLSDCGKYSLSLEADTLNRESFEKNAMIGNGYDWEKIASVYIEKYMPTLKAKFS